MRTCTFCKVSEATPVSKFCLKCFYEGKIPEELQAHFQAIVKLLHRLQLQSPGIRKESEECTGEFEIEPPHLPDDLKLAILSAYVHSDHQEVRNNLGLPNVVFEISEFNTSSQIGKVEPIARSRHGIVECDFATFGLTKNILIVSSFRERREVLKKIFFSSLDLILITILRMFLYEPAGLQDSFALRLQILTNILKKISDPQLTLVLNAQNLQINQRPSMDVEIWRLDKSSGHIERGPRLERDWQISPTSDAYKDSKTALKEHASKIFSNNPYLMVFVAPGPGKAAGDLDWTYARWNRGLPPLENLNGERSFILTCAQLGLLHEIFHCLRMKRGGLRPLTHVPIAPSSPNSHPSAPTPLSRSTSFVDSEVIWEKFFRNAIAKSPGKSYPPHLQMILRKIRETTLTEARDLDILLEIYKFGCGQWTNLEEFFNIFVASNSENSLRYLLELPLRFGHDTLWPK